MKKTFVILITVALLGILAATVAPGQNTTATTMPSSSSVAQQTTTSPQEPTVQAAPTTTTSPSTTVSSQYKDGTFTGSTASNMYDQIQVAITISGGKITNITTPILNGNGGRSQQINAYAVPQLNSQAITAQNSHIDGVSGASYTSDAYSNSLQSALDQASA